MSNLYVVAYDGSPASHRTLDFAVDCAERAGAQLLIAHVLEWSPYSFLTPEEVEERHTRRTEELERAKAALMDPIVESLAAKGVTPRTVIRYGHVAEVLNDIVAKEGGSQLFVGRTGHTGMAARLFGAVTISLAQAATVPCTIVP